MEINFLYWNTFKKQLDDEILKLVNINSINFIILLENTCVPVDLLTLLKKVNPDFKHYPTTVFKRPLIFSSITNMSVKEVLGHGRYGIYEIVFTDYKKILLVITHFPSKMDWGNPADHFSLCIEMRSDIELCEIQCETKDTIVVGDFNMNPFEDGLITSQGLHNVNNKEIAMTGSRNFLGKAYSFFYNPMWSFLGDSSRGNVQGTHFFNTYKPINYFWNMYDQIMFRPELIPFFDERELDIISNIDSKPLTKSINGYTRVDKLVSDHLPIKFKIKLQKK